MISKSGGSSSSGDARNVDWGLACLEGRCSHGMGQSEHRVRRLG